MNPLRQIEQEVLGPRARMDAPAPLQEQRQAQSDGAIADGVSAKPASPGADAVAGHPVGHGGGNSGAACASRAIAGRQGRWICPARETWGLAADEPKSPELQARLAYTATAVGSCAQAEKMARTWGSPVSDGCVFHQVQRLGEKAAELPLPTPAVRQAEPVFSLVIMMDGWMAREQGVDWGAGVEGAKIHSECNGGRSSQRSSTAWNNGWKMPRDADCCWRSWPWRPRRKPCPWTLGRQCMLEAQRRGLGRAQVIYLVMDGAVWLWDLAEDRFKTAVKTLGFHHAREHLHAAAEALHGAGTDAAREWLKGMLHGLRNGKEIRVVHRLEELLKTQAERIPENQETVSREVSCFRDHRQHLHYKKMEKAGAPMGSGAVESLGKQLQGRLRGCGQFWSRTGLTHLLRLTVLAPV